VKTGGAAAFPPNPGGVPRTRIHSNRVLKKAGNIFFENFSKTPDLEQTLRYVLSYEDYATIDKIVLNV
jgi:hypothetical protein